jgi:DNA polymerase II large subunit
MGGDQSINVAFSPNMQEYFNGLQKDIEICYAIATEARKKGLDPELKVEIPQALDLAARVEQLVGPKGIAPKIRNSTKKLANRELVSLEIAREIVAGKTYKFNRVEDAIDQAIRTGLAILTEGVLVAPLEGIAEIKLGANKDGSNYVDLYFSGPIRSAGGTGQAMSVLIADIVRREMGIDRYKPTSGEIERYKEEIPLYKRVQHLQYLPSVDEIEKIVGGCPICINGEGTEDEEVTGYRDLPRVETNRLRGGACLVIAEGLCLKAPKIIKHVKKLKLKGWEFLDIFVNKENTDDKNKEGIPAILPSSKYIGEVIAGRPVFSHPSRKGGFRLRYGRARTAGLASTAINPASMHLLDSFVAVGTQLKTERPGKGTIGTPCSEIEGPIVLLQNGDLTQVNDSEDTNKYDVQKIIDLGEILIPFGEFLENNSLLPNSSYVYEWWIQDLQKSIKCLPKEYLFACIKDADEKTKEKINKDFGREISLQQPSALDAFEISKKYNIALHPFYNLFWHDITTNDLVALSKFVKEQGKINDDLSLILPKDSEIKRILTELGALHKQREGTFILDRYSYPLIRCCGLDIKDKSIVETDRSEILKNVKEDENVVSLVSKLSGITIRERAPYRIGTRMGRPEKASPRKMRPPPHVLFPLGNYGGNQRLVRTAAENNTIEVECGVRICPECNKKTHKISCTCGGHTETKNGKIELQQINVAEELKIAQKNIKERDLPETIKGVVGTISKHKTPEPLEKGILRAKHDVSVFKDGTIRFDMTDAPLTHFKPKETHISIEKLKKLGYTKDYLGNPLENDNQICELKVQDVIISKFCAEYFAQVSRFIDDLLVKFYKLDRFYKIKDLEDLTGHLVVGLAPHTSAGALARIIGFTDSQVCFAHPFYHAAKRRNCLSPDTNILLINSEKPALTSLQNLYCNTLANEVIVDDFGTKQKTVEGVNTFAFNPQNGKSELRKITSVLKIKAPKHMMKITLKSGRDFIASPMHRVMVWSNGKLVTKKMVELQKDDKFFVSNKIDFCNNDIKHIDLLSEFSKLNDEHSKDVVIRGIEKFVRKCVKELGGLQRASQKLEINKKTFSNYIYRDSIPLPTILRLLELCHKKFGAIPKTCTLGVKRNYAIVPRMIKVDNSFMRLLGYYLAEGHARFTKKSCYQVGFACTEKEIRDDVAKCIEDVFHIHSCKGKYDISIANRIVHDFFVHILCIGTNAKSKRIPPRLTALPKTKMKELLRTYFSGDGSVEKNRLHVTCSSVNRELLHDIGLQLLRFGIFYRCKEETRLASGLAKKFYDRKGKSPEFTLYYLSIRSSYARKFCKTIGFSLKRKQARLESAVSKERKPRLTTFGDFILDDIKGIVPIKSNSEFLYDVEVEHLHNFPINDFVISNNCDGDEDGLMLLMDALLNFSHAYIPDKRGGRMDLPLILTTRIDPSEVDKEAHNIDTLFMYPLEFYEATLKHENPKELESIMGLVASRLGTELQYEQFGFTHDTDNISSGPKASAYKTLKTMMDKMNAQLNLAAKIRAVDTPDVAYKVIERHFLPDILGNLRAFSKQSIRCPQCNTIYRRIPLQGVCITCKGKLTLTVHEKSVKKYLEISKEIAERYDLPLYARQRIKLVEKSIDSLFMSDRIKTTKLSDFL